VSAVESQWPPHAPSHYTSRSIDVYDAEMTSVKISHLLPQQTYRVSVAARTRAGVGVFSEIFADTRSFSVRKYQRYMDFSHSVNQLSID